MPPLAAVPDLEHELDELYGLPLEDFTRARNDLAARLKRAHQADRAAQVRALRKPSLPAWTVNQLARREPRLVVALLQAGERLRDAQRQALGGRGGAADVGEATQDERTAVRDLVTAARELLGPRGSQPLLDRVSQTLRAASVDPDARTLVQRGRLTEELQPAGFGALEGVRPQPTQSDRGRRERQERQERLNQLRAEARRLAAEAQAAERAADEAEHMARSLRDEARARRADADAAASALSEAEGSH